MLLKLNIGGKSFVVKYDSVQRVTGSLLCDFWNLTHEQRLLRCDSYLDTVGEYFFERSPKIAEPIVGYYMTGSLHKPTDVCLERFVEELHFWRLDKQLISSCCKAESPRSNTANGCVRVKESMSSAIMESFKMEKQREYDDDFEGVKWSKTRKKLWAILEDPSSGFKAKLFAFLSMMFVLLSVIGLVLGSMTDFQKVIEPPYSVNSTETEELIKAQDEKPKKYDHENPIDELLYMEYVCIAWFTFEYCVRLAVTGKKLKFITSPLNLIDLLTILPFYMEVCLAIFGVNAEELRKMHGPMLVARILRVCRSARIFKLARYSTGLQVFGDTMKKSIRELSMLSMFLLTGIIFFSTVMYFLERDMPNTKFYSIPAACWWGVITMTTVGYGDLVPHTPGGKIIATVASVCGIIVLAFPISMIVEKFSDAQEKKEGGREEGDDENHLNDRTYSFVDDQRRRTRKMRSWII